MILILMVVLAFPIGYFVQHRAYALISFLLAASFLFVFQTLNLLTSWLSGDSTAFGKAPTSFPIKADAGEVAAYGIVNLVFILVGIGLVVLGGRMAVRRSVRRDVISVG